MLSIAEKKKLLNQALAFMNKKLVLEENRRGGAADALAESCDLTRRQINAIMKKGTSKWTKKKTEERMWEFIRQQGFPLPSELTPAFTQASAQPAHPLSEAREETTPTLTQERHAAIGEQLTIIDQGLQDLAAMLAALGIPVTVGKVVGESKKPR